MLRLRQITVVLSLAILAACSSAPRKDAPADDATRKVASSAKALADASADAVSAGRVGDDDEQSVRLPAELANRRIVYFAFDSDELRGENLEIVAAHARYLAANGALTVRLEGHTDPKGTREYNIGLGERRAQAVRRALALQGVGDGRLVTVSYGEERLASDGSDEPSMALNRRVELVYRSR